MRQAAKPAEAWASVLIRRAVGIEDLRAHVKVVVVDVGAGGSTGGFLVVADFEEDLDVVPADGIPAKAGSQASLGDLLVELQ